MEEAQKQSFDLVFATYWQSPFLLSQLKSSHYAYFVQSIESRFFEEQDPKDHDKREIDIWKAYCESTYALNVPFITEARWIQEYLYENYNRDAYLVRNGIRKDIYQAEGPRVAARDQGKLRVLVEGPVDVFYKNVPKAVELCRQAGVDEIWLLTSSDIESFPGVDRVFSRIPIHETSEIYRSCDVLVKLSYVEGMFGPPLEMFHCGGTAIVYDVTGHDEYIVHNHNSYVAARDDDQQVVAYLRTLIENQAELERLKQGGLATAEAWPDWSEAAQEFDKTIKLIASQTPASRTYLKAWSDNNNPKKEMSFYWKEVTRFAEREKATGTAAYDRHNFVQIYKVEGNTIDPDHKWFHYLSDEPTTITARLTIPGLPFWIRIDPSVRMGVVLIDYIKVTNCASGETILMLEAAEDFDRLYLDGTVKRIGWKDKAAFVSYGTDPWFFLPEITEGEVGEELEVKMHLSEIGMTQFANRYCGVRSDIKNPARLVSHV